MAAYSQRSAAGIIGSRSPQRNMVWKEPSRSMLRRKVAVVYYLCNRDGHLEHPHFMEMTTSSSSHGGGGGLYLRDFTDRLNMLRGNGMADMYSWSSKRMYKKGFVWQDLTQDDLIHPAHGNDEYVLKGSIRRLLTPPAAAATAAACTSSSSSTTAATTTSNNKMDEHELLAMDEISPPPSSSSPDTLDSSRVRERRAAVGVISGGRMRASAVLMQLISCGSINNRRRSELTSSHSQSSTSTRKKEEEEVDAMGMERDYFSGSLLMDTNKNKDMGALKRSSSYNAHGCPARELIIRASEQ